MFHFSNGPAIRLLALLVFVAGALMSFQDKVFIGKSTQATATQITAVENGAVKTFAITKTTSQTPRAAKAGDNVRITYLDADIAVASKVEVIPAGQ
jgi:hypothetical protein